MFLLFYFILFVFPCFCLFLFCVVVVFFLVAVCVVVVLEDSARFVVVLEDSARFGFEGETDKGPSLSYQSVTTVHTNSGSAVNSTSSHTVPD